MIDWKLFGATLRLNRGRYGLRELGDILNVNISVLSRIERGYKCEADLFMQLCQWMHAPAERFLMGRKSGPEPVNVLADDWRLDGTAE